MSNEFTVEHIKRDEVLEIISGFLQGLVTKGAIDPDIKFETKEDGTLSVTVRQIRKIESFLVTFGQDGAAANVAARNSD